MLEAWIMELILVIAPQYEVPPMLVASIVIVESQGNVIAENYNKYNGTYDRGLMQLNSSWFRGDWKCAETNIRAGCKLLRFLYDQTGTWYAAVIAYNCGYGRFSRKEGPPTKSVEYAVRVFELWNKIDPIRRYYYGERN